MRSADSMYSSEISISCSSSSSVFFDDDDDDDDDDALLEEPAPAPAAPAVPVLPLDAASFMMANIACPKRSEDGDSSYNHYNENSDSSYDAGNYLHNRTRDKLQQ